jgi:hypothetical protein
LQLVVRQFDALERGFVQTSNLTLDKQLKGHLRNEEGAAGTGGVANGGADVVLGEAVRGVDLVQMASKYLREDVVDTGTAIPGGSEHPVSG